MRFLRRTNNNHVQDEFNYNETSESPTPAASSPDQLAPVRRQLPTKFLDLYEQQQQRRAKNRLRGFQNMLSSAILNRSKEKGMTYKSMGLDESTIFSSHNTYIWTACKIGDLNYVRQIVQSSPDQLHLQLQGRTPLYHACHCGHIHIVKELLMAGCLDCDGTCYQSALTPEIRTLLRQYKIVDEQLNGKGRTNKTAPRCLRSSATTVSLSPKYINPSISSPLNLEFSKQPTMYHNKSTSLDDDTALFPDMRHKGQSETKEVFDDALVDSDHMEGLCGAAELCLPPKPARSSIRRLSASFELPEGFVRSSSFCTATSYTKSMGDTNSVISGGTTQVSIEPTPKTAVKSCCRNDIETLEAVQPSEGQKEELTVGSSPPLPIKAEIGEYKMSSEEAAEHFAPNTTPPLPPIKTKIVNILKRRGFRRRPKKTSTVSTAVSTLDTSLSPESDAESRTIDVDLNKICAFEEDGNVSDAALTFDRSVEVFVVPSVPVPVRESGTAAMKGVLAKTQVTEPLHGELLVTEHVSSDQRSKTDAVTTTSDETRSTSVAAVDAPEGDHDVLTLRRSATSRSARPVTPDKSIIDGCKDNPASATVCTEASTTSGFSSIPHSPMPLHAFEYGSNQLVSRREVSGPLTSLASIEYIPCDLADQESINGAVVVTDKAVAGTAASKELSFVNEKEVCRPTIGAEISPEWTDFKEMSDETNFEVTLEAFVLMSEAGRGNVEEVNASFPQTPQKVLVRESQAGTATESLCSSPHSPPHILRKTIVPSQFASERAKPYNSNEAADVVDDARNITLSLNDINETMMNGSVVTKEETLDLYESKSIISLKRSESNESSSEATSTSGTSSVDTDEVSFKDEGSTRDTETESSVSVDDAEIDEEDLDAIDDITENEMTDYDEDMSSAGTFRSLSPTKGDAWCMFADDQCGAYDP